MGLKAKKFDKKRLVKHVQGHDTKYTDKNGNVVPVPKGTETLYTYDEFTAAATKVDAYRIIAHNDEAVVYYEADPVPAAPAPTTT